MRICGSTGKRLRVFLEAYQSVHPLTIGELWALPQMLRLALIDSIRNLAETNPVGIGGTRDGRISGPTG